MADTPIIDANPTHYLKRVDRDTPKFQFVRELVQNGIEAEATEIRIYKYFIPSTDATNAGGKFTIIDNGCGMTAEQMYENLSKMNSSSKSSDSDFHDNFGIGAKITTTMWNPYGVVFLSWHKDDPDNGHMVWLHYNDEYQQICLKGFEVEDEDGDHLPLTTEVNGEQVNVVPLLDEDGVPFELGFTDKWNTLRPKSGHGTCVILLGKDLSDSTWTDSENNALSDRDLKYYLNERYFELPENLKLVCKPAGKVLGLQKAINQMPNDFHQSTHTVVCPNGFEVDVVITKDYATWYAEYLEKNGLSPITGASYANSHFRRKHFNKGYVALEYKTKHTKELYNIQTGMSNLYNWGIHNKKVASLVKLIVRPPLYDKDNEISGVYPNEGRYRLQWRGDNNSRDNEIDLKETQDFFVNNHPQSLKDLIEEASADYKASVVDLTKIFERYGDILKPKKRKVVENNKGKESFDPEGRKDPTNKGSHHRTGSGNPKGKSGTQKPKGKLKGKLKAKGLKPIKFQWSVYEKDSESNETEAFELHGKVYPVFVESRDTHWKVWFMENHEHFETIVDHFKDRKKTCTSSVIFSHVKQQHEACIGMYLQHLENMKLHTNLEYVSRSSLHAKLIGSYYLWDRIADSLKNKK
jgi:hypothetical protein